MQSAANWIAVTGSLVTVAITLLNLWFTYYANKQRFQQEKEKIGLEAHLKGRADKEKMKLEAELKARTEQERNAADRKAAKVEKLLAAVTALQQYRDYISTTVRNGRVGDILASKSVIDALLGLRAAIENSYASLSGLYNKSDLKFLHEAKFTTGEVEQQLFSILGDKEFLPKLPNAQISALLDFRRQLESAQDEMRTLISVIQSGF